MAAATTDLLKKYKSLFSTTLSTGIGTGTGDTITPASVTGLPTDTLITLTFDRVDSGGSPTPTKLERIQGIISGGNFTSYTRGVDGTTEQAHAGGAVIEMIWNADDWNDAVTWGLTEHNQLGGHTNITASNITASGVSTLASLTSPSIYKSIIKSSGSEVITTAGGTTTYTLTPSIAIASYTTGQEFTIKMNATNTGASTINVSGLGAKSLTKGGATALASGDLLIDALYKITYDGTQFQVSGIGGSSATVATQAEVATGTDNTKMVTPLAAQALGGADGWTPATGTWTYASASTITVPSGAASIYQKGDRIKWTQTTVKYGVIVAVADTLLTIAVNTDYTVANAAISGIYYSHQANPIGYPTYFAYAGTWTSSGTPPALGNGTLSTRLSIEGKKATVKGELFTGSTSTYGTGNYYITLPSNLTPANSRQDVGSCWFLNGGTSRIGAVVYNYSSSVGVEFVTVTNSVAGQLVPATWASGDRLNFTLNFEF